MMYKVLLSLIVSLLQRVAKATLGAIAALLLFAGVVGCSNQELTPEQAEQVQFDKEAQLAEDVDTWTRCYAVYKAAGRYTVHINHEHDRRTGEVRGGVMKKTWALKDDIFYNNCRFIVGHMDKYR
jgi:hypothetical protein